MEHGGNRTAGTRIEPLARHPEALAVLQAWFEAEWPAYYGPGGRASARADLLSYAREDGLPTGLLVLRDGRVCGITALAARSIASHAHLSPWVIAGLVDPALRGQGLGGLLIGALEQRARKLGFRCVYGATSTAHGMLLRAGWQRQDTILHEGEELGLYCKSL